MAINDSHKANFATVMRAASKGALALVECQRKSDGKVCVMLCAIGYDHGEYAITPFAEMVDDNPFEAYDPPNPEGGFHAG